MKNKYCFYPFQCFFLFLLGPPPNQNQMEKVHIINPQTYLGQKANGRKNTMDLEEIVQLSEPKHDLLCKP